MPTSLRTGLALFRLIATFMLVCYLVMQIGLTLRELRADLAYLAQPPVGITELPYLGINVDLAQYTPAQQRRALADLADTGFGWVRIRIAWDRIEPQPGSFDWEQTDAMLASIAAAGLEPVVVLNGSPVWARAPQDQSTTQGHLAPPADPGDFARFAAAFAMRYGDQVRYYQIWDEPNIAPHWGARHIEPVGYAQLLTAAATALRATDTTTEADTWIITASLAPTSDRGHLALDEATFLRRLYAAGAAASFDAVAVQPFGFGATPDATPLGRTHLNFRRAQWIRGVMLAAGDGSTPILITRYGWNRDHGSPWGTVTPQDQLDFAITALDHAYRAWPWVMGQAWAIDQPDAPRDDPAWGFALSPSLTDALRAWHTSAPPRPTALTQVIPTPQRGSIIWLGIWMLLLAASLWRGRAAMRHLPWMHWNRWLSAAPARLPAVWGALIIVYHVTTWSPLIGLCWLGMVWLAWLRPRGAVSIALALVPLHIYHKALPLVDYVVRVPPAYALLIALLPAWLSTRPWRARLDLPNLAAWSRLGVGLTGLAGAWYLPGYAQGLLELVLVPLLLFAMLRTWVVTPQQAHGSTMALAAGGVIAALIGLVDWAAGGGTVADGMRRLVGPTFSPNHIALYLVRTLPLLLVLAWAGRVRRAWMVAALVVAGALLLTGSRGGLLLGLPIGLSVLWLLRPARPAAHRRLPQWLLITFGASAGVAGCLLLWLMQDRLANVATIAERIAIWQVALSLWRDHLWLGVGPGGFYWSFPAHLPLAGTINNAVDPNLRHPHNLWLEIATQAGIVGLLWLVAVIALCAWYLLRRMLHRTLHRGRDAKLDWLSVGLIAGLCAGVAHAQVDAWQALPDLAVWDWTALALIVIAKQTKAATQVGSGS